MSVISSFLNWPLVEASQRGAGKSNNNVLERIKVHSLFESWKGSRILDIGGSRLFMLTPSWSLLFSVRNIHRSILPCQRIVCSQLCKTAWSRQTSCSFARFADSDPGCVLLARVGVGRRSNYQIVNINLPKMSKTCFTIVNVHKEIPNIKASPHSYYYMSHISTWG